MKLPFSQQVNGKPTHFVEKIVIGLVKNNLISIDRASELLKMSMSLIRKSKLNPKITTIRRDVKKRWKPKCHIHFIINFRGNKTKQFAPVLPVVSTQKIRLKYYKNTFQVYIDNKLFFYKNNDITVMQEFENNEGMLKLVQNDGFDSIEDFCAYFSENYKGKIIHWTDLKY